MYRTISAVLNFSNLAHNELSDTKTITQPLLGNSFKGRGGNGNGPLSGSMRAGMAASFFYVWQVTAELPTLFLESACKLNENNLEM